MSPEDIRNLLGGYATGTLTAEEQEALFAAALEDQELFDALAREQSLRDLLREPAARAELLVALDTRPNRLGGFWQWLRRPLVAGLATAGVAAIAVVAVWQGMRIGPVKPAAPMMVAELKPQEQRPAASPAQQPTPARQLDASTRSKVAEAPAAVRAFEIATPPMAPPPAKGRIQVADAPTSAIADKKAAPVMAPAAPVPADPAAMSALSGRRADASAPATPRPARNAGADGSVSAVAPVLPPSAPLPAGMARKTETDATAVAQSAETRNDAIKENVALDARALFYLDPSSPDATAFRESGGVVGGARPLARQAAPRTATAPRLGVRVSILRGENEVDLTTVLDPGETVRLKLIPNADGFLYVHEGTRTVARGAAQRLQPFETPELRFEGSGQKQLYITLSRGRQTVAPLSLGNLGLGNMVQSSADQGRATYVVSGPREAGAQRVVVPVTLTYR